MRGVEIRIEKGGKVRIEWNGFIGDTCYLEADKLYELLKQRGIDVNILEQVAKIEEEAKEEQAFVMDEEREGIGW